MADETFDALMRDGEVPLRTNKNKPPAAVAKTAGLLPPDTAADTSNYDERSKYSSGGVSEKQVKKLRDEPIDDSIDLHGMTAIEAHEAINLFLAMAMRKGWRTVEIVHGRGLHSSAGQGVLRGKVRYWLANCSVVLAYAEPPKNSGAVKVRLKKR